MDRLEQRNEGERYARKKRYEKTGGGKGAEVQISDIERKVLTVIGPTATEGIGGGIDSSERRSLTHSTPVMPSFDIQPSTTCDSVILSSVFESDFLTASRLSKGHIQLPNVIKPKQASLQQQQNQSLCGHNEIRNPHC